MPAAHARRLTSRPRRSARDRRRASGASTRCAPASTPSTPPRSGSRHAPPRPRGRARRPRDPDRRRRRRRRRARPAPARPLTCTAPCCARCGAWPSPPAAWPPATARRACRTRGRGEVALLAGSFNAMADALGEREEELRVAGDRLQGILDHASAMISVKDVEGRYLLVGRRWQQVTGRSAAEVIGRTEAELLVGRARGAVARRRPRGHPHRRDAGVRARHAHGRRRALAPDGQVPAQGRATATSTPW